MEDRQSKQVILMRTDLGMSRGKMISQGSHASLGVILSMMNTNEYTRGYEKNIWIPKEEYLDKWINEIFTKISLKVKSEEELIKYYNEAKELKIPTVLIEDIGKTEFNGVRTKTCIAIGPYWSDEIDKITGHLELLR